MIYTFYSYKGGVGRSMALANVAELFYQAGLKVLMVDWDLEAPGLERFFSLDMEKALDKPGVMDMLLRYKKQMTQELRIPEGEEDLPFDKPDRFTVNVYPDATGNGRLMLLPAGRRSKEHFAEYAHAVRTFDWQGFYQNWEGELYFEWLRQQFKQMADVVLIDSRTGVTEMGGVCAYQFADVVVMFCSANQQSLDGTEKMLRDFKRPQVQDLRGRPLEVVIVPARIDKGESTLYNTFQKKFLRQFTKYTPQALGTNSDQFWRLVMPYVSQLSYHEIVAVREGKASDKDMIEAATLLAFTISRLAPKDSPIRSALPETEMQVGDETVVSSKIGDQIVIVGDKSSVVGRLGAQDELDELVTRTEFSVPYRKHIAKEYVGDREKDYERELEHRSVVSVWGRAGIGKTWVGAKLAIQWEKQGFYFSPYSGPPRQAFWFKCKENMGFYDLAFGVAEYLGQRGEESLWHWLQSNPNRTQPPSEVILRLTELLDREQYFLCFDNFHHVGNDQDVRSLFEELEGTLKTTATRVILIGWQEPRIRGIGGHELEGMTSEDIQRWVLALRSHNKGWPDEIIAAKFAYRLIDQVGVNLELMKIAAIDWLEKHTTQDDAEVYLDSLDETKIAELIIERGDEAQAVLLTILSILDEWEDRSTLVDLARQERISKDDLAQALDALRDAGLVHEDRRRYILYESVRDLCHQRQAERKEDLSDLHRRVADIHSDRGDLLSAIDHYLKAEAFSEAIQLLADNTFTITRAGGGERAWGKLKQLQRVAVTGGINIQDGLRVWMLTGDLQAWLGRLDAAQRAVEIGLQGLSRIPEYERPAYKYEEGRLKARLGAILGSKGELEQVMQYLDESKTLMQEYMWEEGIKSQPSRVPALLMVLNDLGIVHCVLANELGADRASNFDKAIQSFEECINMGEAFEGIPHVDYLTPWALVGLSKTYDDRREEGDRELALETAYRGMERFQEIGHQWGIGFANSTLGTIYLRLGDYEKAAEHHQRGLEAAHKCADIEGIIMSSTRLAEINIIQREWPAVDKYLEAAKEALDKVQMSDLAEYVSYFEHWAKGVNHLQRGQTDEGERILHGVLEYFRGSSEDYYETLCVERDLREFNCSVPGLEPPLDSPPAPAEAMVLPSPSPTFMEIPAPDSQIGRYKIEAELGGGAMGIVYKAYDPNVGRFVALKVWRSVPGPRAKELEHRFRREAQAVGKLQHPNIVTVYDADVLSGQWYIAMEYLEGKTLADIVAQEGPQSLEWVASIVTQTCDALNYAHKRQVIHRDIKPSNIIILESDRVKVADFGLSSVATGADLTKSDAFLGTPRYMSPEQIQDPGQVDGRSDLFSLGTVIYELLTGELLFPGEQITPIYHITNPEPVDLSKLSVGLPDSIRQVLEKSLAKGANERFSTCAEFSEAFVRAVKDS